MFRTEEDIEVSLARLIEESDWEPMRVSTYENSGLINLGSGWILARSGPGPADFIANQKTGELIPISAVSRLTRDRGLVVCVDGVIVELTIVAYHNDASRGYRLPTKYDDMEEGE